MNKFVILPPRLRLGSYGTRGRIIENRVFCGYLSAEWLRRVGIPPDPLATDERLSGCLSSRVGIRSVSHTCTIK